ncbi:hypothetical protein T12_8050 [Trichinella patagoniensis]|uniref:Uncharacterized protein n=1 Tax=Trichinella patagoniensis TaxID=990121 RepID=A0A0V0Z556_9BILA|nr:hypothetical protein T12_8050 [Trichinella patagoniensis]
MQIFIPLLYVGLRGFSFNGCWRTVCVHLKTQEWKMDVNDRKTAISMVSITLFYHLTVAYFNYVASKENGSNKKIEIQTIRSKPLTARKRTREDKRRGWGFFVRCIFWRNLYLITFTSQDPFLIRDVNDEEKKKFKQGRHEAERRQYEVEQKKTGGAGGYLSGSILLVPAADIRKG